MTKRLSFEQATARYVHRFTMDHVPSWATKVREDGTYYAPQFSSDREWYENTLFPGESELCMNGSCYTTNHSFPLGKALQTPYRKVSTVSARARNSAAYEDAIQWIASEDAPGDDDIIDDLQGYLTVCLVADIFNRPATQVARHVWNIRHPEQQRGE